MAGVMAHEIAHVAARHGTRQADQGADRINIGTIPLIFLGGWTGYAIRPGPRLAIPMGFLQFLARLRIRSRHAGLAVHVQGRLRSHCFRRFLRKGSVAGKAKPGTMSKVFSTHPPTEDRIKKSQEMIQKYLKAKPEYVVNTSEFNDVKAPRHGDARSQELTDPNDPVGRRCAAIRTARSMRTAMRQIRRLIRTTVRH